MKIVPSPYTITVGGQTIRLDDNAMENFDLFFRMYGVEADFFVAIDIDGGIYAYLEEPVEYDTEWLSAQSGQHIHITNVHVEWAHETEWMETTTPVNYQAFRTVMAKWMEETERYE